MKHCYRCGAEIRDGGYRRVLQTGHSRRVYYGRRRTSVSHSSSEGLRTLCASCAESCDRKAAFEAKAKLVLFCGVAALLGIGYLNQSSKGQASLSVVQQDATSPSRTVQNPDAPTETASIAPPAAPAHEEGIAQPTPMTFPSAGDATILLDPNFPPDAQRVQDRLRALGFSINDPRGVWSKSTDSAIRRFRKSHGLRSEWRWDQSTQTALFAQAR